eukprot:TRINITY_DN1514_c0_g2_i1.p1 TRINITY_DN1514_c0_g2~~TRINITY_DN1514_c0_g2_i1.p1  ORF type:complete len:197 (-),score=59.37 TRINITY_DN1514_c0_g2_i1:80-670(-)
MCIRDSIRGDATHDDGDEIDEDEINGKVFWNGTDNSGTPQFYFGENWENDDETKVFWRLYEGRMCTNGNIDGTWADWEGTNQHKDMKKNGKTGTWSAAVTSDSLKSEDAYITWFRSQMLDYGLGPRGRGRGRGRGSFGGTGRGSASGSARGAFGRGRGLGGSARGDSRGDSRGAFGRGRGFGGGGRGDRRGRGRGS